MFQSFWDALTGWEKWVKAGEELAAALLPIASAHRGEAHNLNVFRRPADGKLFERWWHPPDGRHYDPVTKKRLYREVVRHPLPPRTFEAVEGGEVIEVADGVLERAEYTPQSFSANDWAWETSHFDDDAWRIEGSLAHYRRGLAFAAALRGARGLVEAKLQQLGPTDDAREALREVATVAGTTMDVPDCGSVSVAAALTVHRLSGRYTEETLPVYCY